jgi:periplasmic divalent cation tolerance protein
VRWGFKNGEQFRIFYMEIYDPVRVSSMQATNGEILILMTVETNEQASVLARGLLDARLVACVTCLPGRSFFRWQSSAINDTPEVILLLKSHREKLSAIEKYFATAHPYECPEIIVVAVEQLAESYGAWLNAEMDIGQSDMQE